MTCLWLHKIYSEGQTWVPALPGTSNASKDHTRRTRSMYRIVLHLRCSEVLWNSYICTGFVPSVSQPLPLQVPGGNMDVDTLLHAKAELLSYIPVQQLEMSLHIMLLYLLHIEQFCSNAWDVLRQCIKEGRGITRSSSSASSVPHCSGKCVDWSVLATVRVIIRSDLNTS